MYLYIRIQIIRLGRIHYTFIDLHAHIYARIHTDRRTQTRTYIIYISTHNNMYTHYNIIIILDGKFNIYVTKEYAEQILLLFIYKYIRNHILSSRRADG